MLLSHRLISSAIVVLALATSVMARLPERGPGVDDGVVDTFQGRNGAVFADWPRPQALLVITGELDGYIEPCGCTGKANQKGGLSPGETSSTPSRKPAGRRCRSTWVAR